MQEKIQKIIERIKTKNLRNADETILKEKLEKFFRQNPSAAKEILEKELNEKSLAYESAVKFVKQEMHRGYGAFQKDAAKRDKLLEQLKSNPDDKELLKEILLTHKSTKERLGFYGELKKYLAPYIEGKTILDLGCGLNPLMFDENKIIAVEFNKKDVDFLNSYFSIRNPKSEAKLIDLFKMPEKVNEFKADVVFAWKLFDIIDSKAEEAIIKSINAEYLIASFPTKTLGNRKMNFPRRAGFQKMLRRLGLDYMTKEYENEIFYIIPLT